MLRDMLRLEEVEVGRKHVSTLMKKMGIEAIYRKANASRRNQAHRIYPYLLRHLTIDRPTQVRAMDTTYIPMQKGVVYLSAVLERTPECCPTRRGHFCEPDEISRCDRSAGVLNGKAIS